ncbi:EAL domain-containing protein [Paucibacter sp. B2R-40]|uniref:putative bifunctional diguanylate cyclase/phosphodiesterase n=1 Tax=Paucibacter sp. B2R-40 TaxID=2893554 RepID=UPI0021E3C22F|nr:GGDEF domain-containing response regulator [Paucibacter sp. B2R-40]MCV2355833.1 EAL domain-containing protein [Paucibacter sp. B2R-40]
MLSSAPKPRILVVEDETIVARDLLQQLAELGYESVGHVTRGEDAIELAGLAKPDLVLMDIQLGGGLDGISAAQAIRDRFSLPVVFLTAFAADETLARAKLTEPFGYILKPFSERELRTVLEMALYKHGAEARLRASALLSQTILDNMLDGVISIDAEGQIQSCNKAACTLFGYTLDELLGRNVRLLMPEPHAAQHDAYLQHYREGGEQRVIGNARELEARHRDGHLLPISLLVSEIIGAEPRSFIGLLRDIAPDRQHVEELHRLAYYDSLTGLPNRRLLTERLQNAMQASARSGRHGALMLLDLDHFKQLNDTEGHGVGDELLLQVTQRLQRVIHAASHMGGHAALVTGSHPEGLIARLGGDEFVILLEGLSSLDHEAAKQAELLAGRVLESLREPYLLRDKSYSGTPSIGIVVLTQAPHSSDELLKRADVAMYQAKSAGRNTMRFFDPALQAIANAFIAFELDLREGLERQEFELHYQIQVNSAGAVTGVEALLRWRRGGQQLVPPAQFISIAEANGLILPLGQWVLETACSQLVAWSQQPLRAHWSMAVNVSALQFAQSDFVESVGRALHKTGANPALLKLELTESMLIDDIEDVVVKMKAVKAYGVAFSLDDFGTGYSSLSILKRLPLQQLKIDKSFVHDILNDPNDAVIARTIVALAHNLDLRVIAEGVESAAQRDFLATIGCDAFQGYFFGRPVPEPDLDAV